MSKLNTNGVRLGARAGETGAKIWISQTRANLLASTALVAAFALQPAGALADGNISIDGAAAVNFNAVTDPFFVFGSGLTGTSKLVNITADHSAQVANNTEFDLIAPFLNQVNILAGITVTSPFDGVYTRSGAHATTVNNAGTIDAAFIGIRSENTTGNFLADGLGTGTVNGGTTGIYSLILLDGDSKVQNFTGGITGALVNGVDIRTAGASKVDILNNGDITGALDGIYVFVTNGTEPVTIDGNGHILGQGAAQGVGLAIDVTTLTGDIKITNNNGIESKFDDAVWAKSFGGNILVDNNKDITGADSAVLLGTTGAGTITVTNNGNLTGGLTPGIWTIAALGTTSIQGNGDILSTFDEGITATSLGGDINIGTVATNGVITGNTYGIYADSTAGAGNVSIKVDKDVTGTLLDGILAHSITGNLQIDILAPAVVSGGLHGVTVSTFGDSVVNNAGTIQQIGDTGVAGIGGGNAIWSPFGNNVVNNQAGGEIIGTIFTGGASFTLNNQAGAVWTPGSNAANILNAFTLNDVVNNSGLINTRDGRTTLTLLGNLNNQSGGLIDMTYAGTAPKATDALDVVNFNALAGSTVKFNVDFTKANSIGTEALANDHSSTGLGTADTIVVFGKATPQGVSKVDLATVGSAPTATSGSVALVNAVPAGLADPGLGGFATMVSSDNYKFVTDPSTGAVIYRLVEDSNGGVYLQWAPNVSASSLGGFGGATGSGVVSTIDGSSGATAGEAIASASAAMGGIGGMGLSGGPTGGGALGRIGDLAASGVQLADPGAGDPAQQGGSLKDDHAQAVPGCASRRGRTAWGQGEASRYNFSGGGDGGNAENLSGGLDTDLGNITGRDCDRVAVGIFGFTGWSDIDYANSSADTENAGLGGYLRLSSANGFYAALVGAWNWADQKIVNKVIGSTADRESDGFSGVATLGFLTPIAPGAAIDLRAFVAHGSLDGDAFTDSAGFVISGSEDDLLTVGGSAGIHVALNNDTQAFVRGGVKWAELDSSITAFGITQSGSADEVSGSVEAGLVMSASDSVQVGISGFGEFSDSSDNYGGRAHVGVKF